MSKGYLAIGLILISILALSAINLIDNYSTGNELDYYMLKEVAQASMTDAIDRAYYKDDGTLRIDKEKFAESFLLRFVNTVEGDRDYQVYIYDINEVPPKVTLEIKAKNNSLDPSGDGDTGVIDTKLSAVLVSNNKTDAISTLYKTYPSDNKK